MALVTPSQLLELVKNSERQMTVLTPSRCYYSRQGDSEEETIRFIDAGLLLQQLEVVYGDDL